MKLIIDREDLKTEHRDINCSQTKFHHFTLQVQQAIREVGRATFREYDGSNYNAIYPPTTDEVMRGNPDK
jgi:hypothetical protein